MQKVKIKKNNPLNALNFKKALKCHSAIAQILSSRSISSIEEANFFLNPSLKNIKSPFLLKDMDIAVERIFDAIMKNEKILIFGDYDVDGITATTILLDFFDYINANVSFYIPDRIEEGYSLQKQHLENKDIIKDIKLIITVDCNLESNEVIKIAEAKNIDLIITDHHEVSENFYEGIPFINPKREDCSSGLFHLAGVGVAFYLIIAMRSFLRDKKFWELKEEPNLKNYCELVALGTIADIVPLINENRIFTKIGFDIIKKSKRLGIQALLNICHIKQENISSDDIPFKIAPRINAAGRIERADLAVHLLRTKNFLNAEKIAQKLETLNSKRQVIEKTILNDIENYLIERPEKLKDNSIILANYFWHSGVIGIVASKLAKKYKRPVILIALKDDNFGKASARSIEGFDLYKTLWQCRKFLGIFGGHSMAAGFSIHKDNISSFIKKFNEISNKNNLINEDKTIFADYELDFTEISQNFIREIEKMQPFGMDNFEPLFYSQNLEILNLFLINNKHTRFTLKQTKSNPKMNAICFNYSDIKAEKKHIDGVTFKLSWNYVNNNPQMIIQDIL